MKAIRLTEKHARALLDLYVDCAEPRKFFTAGEVAALEEIRRQLAPRPKSSQVRKTERKRRTKREETAAIREAVFARADGRCEACSLPFGDLDPGELDHFFGRGKAPQSIENCWALCRDCHRAKTANRPDAAHWLKVFLALVAEAYGYRKATAKARNRLAFVNARGGR